MQYLDLDDTTYEEQPNGLQHARHLLKLSGLTALSMRGVPNTTATEVFPRLTGLEELAISASPKLTCRGLLQLTALTRLTLLAFDGGCCSRSVRAALAGCSDQTPCDKPYATSSEHCVMDTVSGNICALSELQGACLLLLSTQSAEHPLRA